MIHPALSQEEAGFRWLKLTSSTLETLTRGVREGYHAHTASSPFLIEQLLHLSDVTLITHGKVFHHHLGVLLISFANGSLICLKLNNVDCSVRGS
ncbi:hypothetical protein llap_19468 [Limosa lapponica baueri]|uniref:Uncharacterized protein n=1 Tax=Limosa lapponica baueri TaxID=1758121 RepID=A0A2I0T8V7_LIMLA|nr:hypothetical protein llap_19468 [Limosa lapponica baueri]